jgi:hypothetical protein
VALDWVLQQAVLAQVVSGAADGWFYDSHRRAASASILAARKCSHAVDAKTVPTSARMNCSM